MTIQEFKKAVTKRNWFEKYYYYFLSFSVIGVGLFSFYLGVFHTTINQTTKSRILIISAALFFLALGSISLYLIPNRYKIMTFGNKAPADKKKKIIADTMKDFDAIFIDNRNNFWVFNYQRRWWTFDYNVYVTFDDDTILACVVGRTPGRGGFIDFGQTERFRKKLSTTITEKLK